MGWNHRSQVDTYVSFPLATGVRLYLQKVCRTLVLTEMDFTYPYPAAATAAALTQLRGVRKRIELLLVADELALEVALSVGKCTLH